MKVIVHNLWERMCLGNTWTHRVMGDGSIVSYRNPAAFASLW